MMFFDIDRTVVNTTVLSNFEVTTLKSRFRIVHPWMVGWMDVLLRQIWELIGPVRL